MISLDQAFLRFPHAPSDLRGRLERMLDTADVRLDGSRPWDVRVHDDRLWRRIALHGSLGVGESYVDGWWDCDAVDELMARVSRARIDRRIGSLDEARLALLARLRNPQNLHRSAEVAHVHYDLDDALYRAMLDRRMIYSCGYWREARDLDAAQEAKLSLVFRKLGLEPGMSVLDIGCGWGGAARYAAERHGVRVTGITVSEPQARVAAHACRGLPVDIRMVDYRRMSGRFDRIYSIGMFEHVGYRNYRTYFEKARELLHPDGLFLLHTIGADVSLRTTDPWIAKYVFPNSMLPSAAQITAAIEGLFVFEDWHQFGADYDTTLMCWHRNFQAHWPELAHRFDERFRRLWSYYLSSSAGTFRARSSQLWQLLLSPRGIPGGWTTVR